MSMHLMCFKITTASAFLVVLELVCRFVHLGCKTLSNMVSFCCTSHVCHCYEVHIVYFSSLSIWILLAVSYSHYTRAKVNPHLSFGEALFYLSVF